MIKLNPPLRCTTSDLDTVIARSRGNTRASLIAARTALINLFEGYVNQQGWDHDNLQDLIHIPNDVRKAMLRSYRLTYKGKALSQLRTDLLAVPDDLCPYCRLAQPTTLDHFLAKSKQEPFASFAPNLVPMCAECNTLKGTKGSAKARQFFTHAYFDQIAKGDRFMVAQVAVGKSMIATNFTIDITAGLDGGIVQRLAYQMSVLRLVERYQREAIDVIHEQAVELDDMVSNGCSPDDCRLLLTGYARSQANTFGSSYWKAALLSALASNFDFCSGGFEKALRVKP